MGVSGLAGHNLWHQVLDILQGSIRGGIVHDNEFEVLKRLRRHARQRLIHKTRPAVAGRDDDADERHRVREIQERILWQVVGSRSVHRVDQCRVDNSMILR